MRADTWLPIVTLVLGWAGAQITEAFRDRRTSDRERQAHERERRVRQAEAQRATLLDLQDALLELSNRTREVRFARIPELLWKHMSEAAQVEASGREHQARVRLWDTHAKVSLLQSRVLDADARHAVSMFAAISHLAIPMGESPATADMHEVSQRYSDAIERLGELIRERY